MQNNGVEKNSALQPALLMKIQELRGNLSRAECKVVDYITKNPQKVITLSVAGLAEASGVSDATVVRTCRKIGMSGYQDLKVTLAQDLVSPLERIHEGIRDGDSNADILNKVFASTIHALEYTLRILDKRQFEQALHAIDSARFINIYGCGNSASVAFDLQHKLMRLGMHVEAFSDGHMQSIAATALQKGDVCIVISHSGSSKDIVSAAQLARKNGATVICMTGIGRSPLSETADIRLDTASKETRYHIVALSSRISQYTIIDSLYASLALMRQDQARKDTIEQALSGKKF